MLFDITRFISIGLLNMTITFDKARIAFYYVDEKSEYLVSCVSSEARKNTEATMVELNGETYLDGNEACHLLGVKVSTLYTYVSRGVLKSYRQGIKRQR